MIIIIAVLALSSLAFGIEYSHYDNYVYATYHINLAWLTLLSAGTLTIYGLWRAKATFTTSTLLVVVALFVFGYYLPSTLGRALAFLRPSTVSYNQQLVAKHGELINYLNFVRDHAQGNIMIPFETSHWKYTGNSQFVGAWVYPDLVYTYSHFDAPDLLPMYDYVVLSSEENSGSSNTWPDFIIPAEKVVIYNWQTGEGEEHVVDVYNPAEWKDKEPWGLIKIKKS